MNGRRLFWIALLALSALAVLAATSAVADPMDINNPPTHDWFFDSGSSVTISGKTWDVNYNITVANDTKLTFSECTFNIGDPADINSRWIWSMWNGSIDIYNCSFTGTGNVGFFIYMENSSRIMGSTFTGMVAPNPVTGGISIFDSDLVIGSSKVMDTNGIGIWAYNCNIVADSLSVTTSGYDSTDAAAFMAMYEYTSWDQMFSIDVMDSMFSDNPYRGFAIRAYDNWADINAYFENTEVNNNGRRGLDIYWGRDGYTTTSNASLDFTAYQCTFNNNYWDGFRYQQYDVRMNADSTVSLTLDDCDILNGRGSGAFINVYRGDQAFDLTVKDCEFVSNAFGGRAGLAFENRYMYNYWNVTVINTLFDDNDYYGLHFNHYSTMVDGGHITVQDCTFTDEPVGMYIYNYRSYDHYNDFFIDGCSFSGMDVAGVYQVISYSQLPVNVYFDNCDFSSSSGAGAMSYGSGDQSDGAHWEFSDCTFTDLGDRGIKFDLDYVMSGATLMVDGCTLDETGGIEFMVANSLSAVQASHELRVENTDIMNSSASAIDAVVYGYYGVELMADIDTVTVDDALFNGLRLIASPNYLAATASVDMEISISDLNINTIGGNGINVGTDDVTYAGTRTIDVDGLMIDTVNKGMVLNSVKGDFYSTTITSSFKEDIMAIYSDVEIYEPTLDALNEDTVQVIDSGSVKFWYTLGVKVMWDTGTAVEGAVVRITDNQHTLIGVRTQMDENGLDPILLNSFQFRETGLFTRSPYLLNVSFRAISKVVPVELDMNRDVIVELADHMPPEIFINEPMMGHLQKEKTINVRGASYDSESDVDTVEVSIDGVNWITTATTVSWDYSFTVTQQDIIDNGGMFTIRARATDMAGNVASQVTTVEIDPFPPELRVNHPYDGLQTNNPDLAVRGVTEAGATVTVNGEEVAVTGTLFVAHVDLVEGPNTITVDASDSLGNSMQEKMEVVLDTKAPYLVLLSPMEAEMFTEPTAMVSGQAEDDLTIMVNGNMLGANHYDNGTFEYAVSLTRGENMITVKATDMAGNTITMIRTVLLDDQPPILAVQSPIGGSFQNDMDIAVIGTTDEDTMLLINDELVSLDHGLFSYDYVGVEGDNEIIITASDVAGNMVEVTLTVHIDTEAPTIMVSSPPMETEMVTDASYVISGQSAGAVSVLINGDSYDVETDGSFAVPVTLLEGQNRFIITVVDMAGNSVTENRYVTLDTISPVLVVRIPDATTDKNGKMTIKTKQGDDATMTITGFTDDAIQIRINGDLVPVTTEGYFEVEYQLTVKSPNTITVTAVDAAGNQVEVTQSVTHSYTKEDGGGGLDVGFVLLILGIILLVIFIFIGWRRLSAVEETQEIVVEEDEVLAPAAMPEVEEEEEEEVPEEEEEDLEVDEEDEEEVHELTPPSERPKTDTSRSYSDASDEEVTIEIDEKDLEEKDAEGDVDADESEQEEGI